MIVTTDQLATLRGQVAMVDGGFDPLHSGHTRYFEAAARLGHPVLCNVSPDSYVETKHPVLLPEMERVQVLDAFRWLDYVHLSTGTTVAVLEELRPRCYVKGSDWRGRLPQPEQESCRRHGIEIVYLDTVTHSSTDLLSHYNSRLEVRACN
jgi:D-beta-D-heptose 7-phosphate kinase/D-beta-D-heptose 1-phosphate adenosyltransferase